MAEISITNVRLDHNYCEHIIIRIENMQAEEETFGFIRLKITPCLLSFSVFLHIYLNQV